MLRLGRERVLGTQEAMEYGLRHVMGSPIGKNVNSLSDGRKYVNHIEPLFDVEYADSFPAYNFFEMQGYMPGNMIEEWYHDRNGNASSYYVGRYNVPQREEWQKKYWEAFQKHILRKVSKLSRRKIKFLQISII